MGTNRDGDKPKKKRKGGILSLLVLLIALGVLIYSGLQVYEIGGGYIKARREFTQLRTEVVIPTQDEEIWDVDFETLKAQNEDIVAWIRFPQPEIINYPVLRAGDNDFYLHKNFEKAYSFPGSIFEDYQNNRNFSDRNVILYGHNMNDRSMFAELRNYINAGNQEYYQQNPYFYIYLPDDAIYKYQIFAAYEINVYSDEVTYTIFRNDCDPQEFLDWQNQIKSRSLYDTGVAVDKDAHYVTLSTCTNRAESGRFIVVGSRVETVREPDPAKKMADDIAPAIQSIEATPVVDPGQ